MCHASTPRDTANRERASPARHPHLPRAAVFHFPSTHSAGSAALLDTHAVPPPSFRTCITPPASHLAGHSSAYWQALVPAGSVHAAPSLGCSGGQPFDASPP